VSLFLKVSGSITMPSLLSKGWVMGRIEPQAGEGMTVRCGEKKGVRIFQRVARVEIPPTPGNSRNRDISSPLRKRKPKGNLL